MADRFYDRIKFEIVESVPRSKPKKMPDGSVLTTRFATIKDARAMRGDCKTRDSVWL